MTKLPGISVDALRLEEHRPVLLKFAMLQLHNEVHAEDAVQETILAAIQGAERFAGGSSVRTWLIGILKNKIIDQIRRTTRERAPEPADDDASLAEVDAMFDERGSHVEKPAKWGSPEQALSQREFFEVLEKCMEGLPGNTARVFMMREVMGLDTGEICNELGISATNCGVLLYRARMGLRACLDQRWFASRR